MPANQPEACRDKCKQAKLVVYRGCDAKSSTFEYPTTCPYPHSYSPIGGQFTCQKQQRRLPCPHTVTLTAAVSKLAASGSPAWAVGGSGEPVGAVSGWLLKTVLVDSGSTILAGPPQCTGWEQLAVAAWPMGVPIATGKPPSPCHCPDWGL